MYFSSIGLVCLIMRAPVRNGPVVESGLTGLNGSNQHWKTPVVVWIIAQQTGLYLSWF